jgi:hypothetical protein
MTNRTRTQITIHTQQRIVVHSLPNSYRAWCERCGDVVVVLTPECVETVLRVTAGALAGLFESGNLHAIDSGSDSPLICGNSLSKGATEAKILIEGAEQ